MSKKFYKQTQPFIVPTEDGKAIKEHFGLASTNEDKYSVAHMIAPSGWSEPFQIPTFDEVTFMIKGKKKIVIDDQEVIILKAGESLLIKKDCRVQYSNPFEEVAEYVSICVPAFSIDSVNRED